MSLHLRPRLISGRSILVLLIGCLLLAIIGFLKLTTASSLFADAVLGLVIVMYLFVFIDMASEHLDFDQGMLTQKSLLRRQLSVDLSRARNITPLTGFNSSWGTTSILIEYSKKERAIIPLGFLWSEQEVEQFLEAAIREWKNALT